MVHIKIEETMKNSPTWKTYLSVATFLFLASSSFASTFFVGTCHAGSFSTISAAVAAAPAGSTVAVCPGTYQEQVFITQPITLQGITSGGADRARIVVPASVTGGPPNWQFVPDPDFINQVAPQIFVNSPGGSVKISNLTIDGSGEHGASTCAALVSGAWITTAIFFENSSGTVNEVDTLGQGINSGCGVGIRAYAAPPASPTVTITNNSINDANLEGIFVEAPTAGGNLNVSVMKNTLMVGANDHGSYALFYTGISGTISSNFIQAQGHGVLDEGASGPLTFADNTIISTNAGIGFGGILGEGTVLPGPQTLTGNRVVNYYVGITVGNPAHTLKGNAIVNSFLAIELGCNATNVLTANTVNNAQIGMDTIPAGFSAAGKISFFNVDQIAGTTPCP
jgi:hypothetical protein